jgi:hypothetical protein
VLQCAKLRKNEQSTKLLDQKTTKIPIICDFYAKNLANSKNSRTFAAAKQETT